MRHAVVLRASLCERCRPTLSAARPVHRTGRCPTPGPPPACQPLTAAGRTAPLRGASGAPTAAGCARDPAGDARRGGATAPPSAELPAALDEDLFSLLLSAGPPAAPAAGPPEAPDLDFFDLSEVLLSAGRAIPKPKPPDREPPSASERRPPSAGKRAAWVLEETEPSLSVVSANPASRRPAAALPRCPPGGVDVEHQPATRPSGSSPAHSAGAESETQGEASTSQLLATEMPRCGDPSAGWHVELTAPPRPWWKPPRRGLPAVANRYTDAAKRNARMANSLKAFLSQFPSKPATRVVEPSPLELQDSPALANYAKIGSELQQLLLDVKQQFARLCEHVSGVEKAKGRQLAFGSLIPGFRRLLSLDRDSGDVIFDIMEAVSRHVRSGIPIPELLIWLLFDSLPAETATNLHRLLGHSCPPDARDRLAFRLAILSQRDATHMLQSIRVLRCPAGASKDLASQHRNNIQRASPPIPNAGSSRELEGDVLNSRVPESHANDAFVISRLLDEMRQPVSPTSSNVPPSPKTLAGISCLLKRFSTAEAVSTFLDMCVRFGWSVDLAIWQNVLAAHSRADTLTDDKLERYLDATSREWNRKEKVYDSLLRHFALKRDSTGVDIVLNCMHGRRIPPSDGALATLIMSEATRYTLRERAEIGEWTLRMFGVTGAPDVTNEWLQERPLLLRVQQLVSGGTVVPGINTLSFAIHMLNIHRRWNIVKMSDEGSRIEMRRQLKEVCRRALAILRATCDIPESVVLPDEPAQWDIAYTGPRLFPTTLTWRAILPMLYANYPLQIGDGLIRQMEGVLSASSPPDAHTYNVQLAAHFRQGDRGGALEVYSKMRIGAVYPGHPPITPDHVTLLLMVSGLARNGDREKAVSARQQIWTDLCLRRGYDIDIACSGKASEDGRWSPHRADDARWAEAYRSSELSLLRQGLRSGNEEAVQESLGRIASWKPSRSPSAAEKIGGSDPPVSLLTKTYDLLISHLVGTDQVRPALALLSSMVEGGVARSLHSYTPFVLRDATRRDVRGVQQWLDRIRADGVDVDIPLRTVLDGKLRGWYQGKAATPTAEPTGEAGLAPDEHYDDLLQPRAVDTFDSQQG